MTYTYSVSPHIFVLSQQRTNPRAGVPFVCSDGFFIFTKADEQSEGWTVRCGKSVVCEVVC